MHFSTCLFSDFAKFPVFWAHPNGFCVSEKAVLRPFCPKPRLKNTLHSAFLLHVQLAMLCMGWAWSWLHLQVSRGKLTSSDVIMMLMDL